MKINYRVLLFVKNWANQNMQQNKSNNFITRLSSAVINLFETPWSAAVFSGLIYMIVSAHFGKLFQQSNFAYYNYLADALLHGQTWLRQTPPVTLDLSLYDGKYFLYWPPFPAFLLLPFVAIFGIQFNDVFFTLLIGAINVGLIAQLLRKACQVEFLRLSKTQRAILVIFFAFGTVHFPLALSGKVWMTAQIVGFKCVLLSYLFALSLKGGKAWFFTGLALSAAILTRNNLLFTGIFPFVYLIYQPQSRMNIGEMVKNIGIGILPIILTLTFYLSYNQIRFDNPFETGLTYHLMSTFFQSDYAHYGAFNLYYIPINIYYQYIFYPFPLRSESLMGGSLFLLSPLFIGFFFAFWKPNSKVLTYALLGSVFLTNIPILLLMGTGYAFFGPRYTLDFTVPFLLLTALGIEKWKSKSLPIIFTLTSVIHYLLGSRIY